ncbi:MAG: hypothetical protein ICV63_18485 [Coleofasciculus sp. Co-bin14]|nr:hypothetical protein [Coleofasciculus sp. Co-bin14]
MLSQRNYGSSLYTRRCDRLPELRVGFNHKQALVLSPPKIPAKTSVNLRMQVSGKFSLL